MTTTSKLAKQPASKSSKWTRQQVASGHNYKRAKQRTNEQDSGGRDRKQQASKQTKQQTTECKLPNKCQPSVRAGKALIVRRASRLQVSRERARNLPRQTKNLQNLRPQTGKKFKD